MKKVFQVALLLAALGGIARAQTNLVGTGFRCVPSATAPTSFGSGVCAGGVCLGLWCPSTGPYANQLVIRNSNGTDSPLAGGSVSSVGMTVPSWLSVSGSPITSSGTLTVTAATGQTANQVLASPNGAPGAFAPRALVAADLPGGSIANSVSNSDSTLTISPTTGAVVASLNLGHANTWSGIQTFNGALAAGTAAVDFSGSSGAFKTTTGASTFGGSANLFTLAPVTLSHDGSADSACSAGTAAIHYNNVNHTIEKCENGGSWTAITGGGAAMAIGSAVTGGTNKSMLYVDSSGNLAQDNLHLTYDPATQNLTSSGSVTTQSLTAGSNDLTVSGNTQIASKIGGNQRSILTGNNLNLTLVTPQTGGLIGISTAAYGSAGATGLSLGATNQTLVFGASSGDQDFWAEIAEQMTASGTVGAGDVVCWTSGSGKTVVQCSAAANATTIAGVALTGGTNATIMVVTRGRTITNCENSTTTIGGLVGTSGTTAGRVTLGTPGAGAIVGRVVAGNSAVLTGLTLTANQCMVFVTL